MGGRPTLGFFELSAVNNSEVEKMVSTERSTSVLYRMWTKVCGDTRAGFLISVEIINLINQEFSLKVQG